MLLRSGPSRRTAVKSGPFLIGGEGGYFTSEPLAREGPAGFQDGAINRSATSPFLTNSIAYAHSIRPQKPFRSLPQREARGDPIESVVQATGYRHGDQEHRAHRRPGGARDGCEFADESAPP